MEFKTIEAIMNGETPEELDNPDCWIALAEDKTTGIPDYLEAHEERRKTAQIQEYLNMDYQQLYQGA